MRRRVSSAAATTRAREAASWARLTAFEMAVAASSAKPRIRASVSSGNGSGFFEATLIVPQTRPSTTIGAPTDERIPSSRMSAAAGPDNPS